MPDDNRFAGLSEVVEEDGEDAGSGETSDTESANSETVAYEDETASESGTETDSVDEAESESESELEPESETDPTAFAFDETTKKTVYVRQETIDALEDARALVDAQLRTQHDVRDLTGREFYDAAFRLAAADTDGLIDEIRDEREE